MSPFRLVLFLLVSQDLIEVDLEFTPRSLGSTFSKRCYLDFSCLTLILTWKASACMLSHSVVSNSLQSYELYPTRLLCPWDSSRENTGMGTHALLQGILLTQGSNLLLLHLLQKLACRFFTPTTTWEHRIPLNLFREKLEVSSHGTPIGK